MSSPLPAGDEPITDSRQLAAYLEAGSKPMEKWQIGTEHEKFAFYIDDHRPVPYEGSRGIGVLLAALSRFGWAPIEENGVLIGLKDPVGCSVTLEPGGQVELSGAPLPTIHQTCNEVNTHLRQVREVGGELGIGMVGLGFMPKWRREDIPWMPKGRYAIMRDYMPKRGSLGLDMMCRTCTVQVNLDFADEADMVSKMRIGLALQPVATALFGNSPFSDGQPNGFQSYRSHIWTDTDPDRTGELPFVFEPGFGFERYVDYALDVPMYFVYRDGRYIDASGQSFRDFMAGRLPALPGQRPTISDWSDHLTTLFPEVRLKRFIEMRGADGGPWRRLCALPALWVGLLYDRQARNDAAALIADWTGAERAALRAQVPRHGLRTPFRDRTVRELAVEVLAIAKAGLQRRNRPDSMGADESGFLAPLHDIADSGRSPADRKLALFHEEWDGQIDQIYEEFAY